jgi:hypothetical protein
MVGSGAKPDGISVGDQAIWNRWNDCAGDRGGARADKPRDVRILAITVGPTMAAMIFKVPPHWGQCSMSISEHPFEQSGPAHAGRRRRRWRITVLR